MSIAQLIATLGRNDARLIGRDRFLLFMFFFVLYLAVVLRLGLPWLNSYLATNGLLPSETTPQSLVDFYPMIIAWLVIFTGALLAGTIFGFALLDEKDDNTLKAMLVTPIPPSRYVLYKICIPTLFAFFIVVALFLFIAQAMIPPGPLLLIAAGASLTAPIIMLFYAIVADNKVQGFAMSKFAGLAGWVILLGWFVDDPFQWLFGLFPPFLISKAYWMVLANNPLWWIALLAGIILQVGLILLLIRRFKWVVYR